MNWTAISDQPRYWISPPASVPCRVSITPTRSASPPIRLTLAEADDHQSTLALVIILRDEISHVGLGEAWQRQLLYADRGLEPEATYRVMLMEFNTPLPQSPLNESAQLAAGFSAAGLAALAHPGLSKPRIEKPRRRGVG